MHISISNDISLFILHFPNLTARKNHARSLLFSYWIWKSNWKNKKPRLEFPLNLAVSEMEETEQGSKWWNIFVKSRVCWNEIWSVFFSICLLNRACTILFFPLHYCLDLFFSEQNCVLALLFGAFCFLVIFTSEFTPFKMFMGFLCYRFFLSFHLFGHFCLLFCQVVSAEVFFSLLSASYRTFIGWNALLLCTELFLHILPSFVLYKPVFHN